MNFNYRSSKQGAIKSPSAFTAQLSTPSGAPSWSSGITEKQTPHRETTRPSPQLLKMERKHKAASTSSHPKNQDKRLVNGKAMAGAIDVSTKTLQRMRRDGVVGFYRLGGCIRYDVVEVMEALADYHVMSRALIRPKATSTR